MRTLAFQSARSLRRGRAPVVLGTFVVATVVGASSCGGASSSTSPPSSATGATAAAPPPQDAPLRRTLTRSIVRAAVAQGLGAFLQHVDLDERPVRAGGRFHGFRITALHDSSFWSGVDLKPGDVVTRVNGLPIERPEQAQAAFESLASAGELRVSYERDGEPRELVYPIVDDR